jgi:hypothetical protein
MSTTTVMLESQGIAEAAQSLTAEFHKAKLTGFKTTASKEFVRITMPLAELANAHFTCAHNLYSWTSWTTPKRKIVVNVEGFAVEQRAQKNGYILIFKQSRSRLNPVTDRVDPADSNVRKVFRERSLRAIDKLVALDEKKLVEAVAAPTDQSVLLFALNTVEALAGNREQDPLAGARLRGLEAKRRLLDIEGGTLSSGEAAHLLQITRQAIDKRRKEGKLLAVELGKKGYYYPVWQFELKGLEEVLRTLRDRDVWEQLSFFVNPSFALDDRTPLDILRKGKKDTLPAVIQAAAAYGEQGG